MLDNPFVHLHVHSHYSLLDGAATVESIVEAARRFNMSAIALTDHGNMYGALDLLHACEKAGIKPIFGFEAYLTAKGRFTRIQGDPRYHLVLLARNNIGYKNLIKLTSLAFSEGFYYKPRIDFELLEQYHEGLIGLGACLQGEVASALLQGDKDKAKAAIKRYQKILGAENFYVELQDHSLPEQKKILNDLAEVAAECNAPLVATNDSHYVKFDDWEAQDALLALGSNAKLSDEKRMRFGSKEFYLKSQQEMAERFALWPESITNTKIIADRCDVKLKLGKSILPEFEIPDKKTPESYLMELCQEGLIKRYGTSVPDEVITKRLEYEFDVITKMGFSAYFLIVWDFITAARKMGVPVGPGRGSAAGSIVAYLLGITDIDPIKYHLLFERFLNPERISMPDIDVDFSDDGRARVIDYVVKKYGRKRVSQIVTFNVMLAKMAIRDIGRVLGMPLSDVDRIAKLVPEKPGTHLKRVLNEIPELKEMAEHGSREEKKLLEIACKVDGLARHTGVHACGIVISKTDLDEIVPMATDPKTKDLVTQYEKHGVEEVGLLKMDFLGLKTLSIIQRAEEYIKQNHNQTIDWAKIPLDDKKTFELLKNAQTLGVFQLESSGMRNLITNLQPSVFEDIIALLAMYRPGPLNSGMVNDFVERKHGRKALAYPHPELEPVLKDTYGVYLYQEQVMQTANIIANFSMSEADTLRKAMGKKIPEVMAEMGEKFIKGAVKRGIDQTLASDLFKLMAGFAEYGFNKSHSAAYALVTYRTAYLKAHYPVEFMASVLSSELNDTGKIGEYIDECRGMGIKILPPDINVSKTLFTVEGGNISFGLSAIKGVGESAIESIIQEREKNGRFKSFCDFMRRINIKQINSKSLEVLIKGGAFDCTGLKKSQLLAMLTDAIKLAQQEQKNKSSGQTTFFDLFGEDAGGMGDLNIEAPSLPELSEKELLLAEKTAFGFYLTGDPFASVAPLGRAFSTHTLAGIAEAGDNQSCRVAGILTQLKRHITKKGDTMAFATIEADNASLDVSIFPKVFEQSQPSLIIDEPVFMLVSTQLLDGSVKVNAEKVLSLSDFNVESIAKITAVIPAKAASKANYEELLKILRQNVGATPLTIRLNSPEGHVVEIKPSAQCRVCLRPALIAAWEEICGKHSFILSFAALEQSTKKIRRPSFYANSASYRQ